MMNTQYLIDLEMGMKNIALFGAQPQSYEYFMHRTNHCTIIAFEGKGSSSDSITKICIIFKVESEDLQQG